MSNGACGSVGYPFTVTINPIPDVTVPAPGSQVVCNTASTTEIDFTGGVPGTTFNWTNSDSTIGLASSGAGNIASFIASDTGSVPVTAVITVTPSANGCTGAAQTYSITVNPSPNVAASSNQDLCNGSPTTGLVFSGSVAGTVFSWSNSDTTIGLASSGTEQHSFIHGYQYYAQPGVRVNICNHQRRTVVREHQTASQ